MTPGDYENVKALIFAAITMCAAIPFIKWYKRRNRGRK